MVTIETLLSELLTDSDVTKYKIVVRDDTSKTTIPIDDIIIDDDTETVKIIICHNKPKNK